MNDTIRLAIWLFVLPAVFLLVVLGLIELVIGGG